MRSLAGLALLVVLAGCSRPAEEPLLPGWTRLENGLQVCVHPVPGATHVAVLVSFSIGAEHDPEGRVGLAHLTEHLYVTAAAGSAPARTSDEWNARYPDGCTAGTRGLETRCSTVVGPEALDAELADAAARMADLRIEQADLDRERRSVLEQIGGLEASPASFDWRQIALGRLGVPTAALRPAGVRADVETISLADVSDRCARFYKPCNARLVVAGAVDPAAVSASVVRWFASIPRGERIPPPTEGRPPQPGLFEVPPTPEVAAAADRARLVAIVYPPRAGAAPDRAALELLRYRSTESRSAQRMLVLDQAHGGRIAPTIVCLREDRPLEAVLEETDAEIPRWTENAPTPEEIRHRVGIRANRFARLGIVQPVEGQPVTPVRLMFVASSLVPRSLDWETAPDDYAAALAAITKEDLRRVAATWLSPEGRVAVAACYVPDPAESGSTLARRLRPVESERRSVDEVRPEVRVSLRWDEEAQRVRRQIGDREFAEDESLQKAVADARDVLRRKGSSDVYAIVDADRRVPWRDVVTVMNLCKRSGIDRIEFAFDMHPDSPTPK